MEAMRARMDGMKFCDKGARAAAMGCAASEWMGARLLQIVPQGGRTQFAPTTADGSGMIQEDAKQALFCGGGSNPPPYNGGRFRYVTERYKK